MSIYKTINGFIETSYIMVIEVTDEGKYMATLEGDVMLEVDKTVYDLFARKYNNERDVNYGR